RTEFSRFGGAGFPPAYRMIAVAALAEIVGLPALRTVPLGCTRATVASIAAGRAAIPTMTRLMAPASATATILQWVRQSAPIMEWDISGSSLWMRPSPQGRSEGRHSDSANPIF